MHAGGGSTFALVTQIYSLSGKQLMDVKSLPHAHSVTFIFAEALYARDIPPLQS